MKKQNTLKIASLWFNDNFFSELLGGRSYQATSLKDLEFADILVLWGGEDINPKIYGEKNSRAYTSPQGDRRDEFESRMFYHALGNIPIIGICRGAQLSCALLGGKLWQHIEGHTSDHQIKLNPKASKLTNKEKILVTSTHHQMMRPTDDMEVIAVSEVNHSPTKINGHGTFVDDTPEYEILFHPKKVLMIQGHPEYNTANRDFKESTKILSKTYLEL